MAAHILRRSALRRVEEILKKNHWVNYRRWQGIHTSCWMRKVIPFNLSDIGEGIREVTVKEWFVKVGDVVQQFDNLCEVQSDKATVTITSRYDGKIVKIHHNVDDIALVGKALMDFHVEDEAEDSSSSSDEEDSKDNSEKDVKIATSDAQDVAHRITLATPAVRRIAKEYNVDLSKVKSSGPNGRVLKGDVLEYLGHIPRGDSTTQPNNILNIEQKIPTTKGSTSDRIEVMKGVRKAMLKSMTETLKIPHFAYSDEVDVTRLLDFRNQLMATAQQEGVPKLTFMPFCIKAASLGLTKYPILNSVLDLEREAIVYKSAHNISVAIDTPNGLVVPNIKNCQSKDIIQIAKDLAQLVERGRSGSLSVEDFCDGTFTLSNIGIIGGTYTHPCIMAPQVSIGGIGRTKAIPRFNDKDELVKVHIMNISWCADHRVIDGATMANFSNFWKRYLENPALFLIN